MRYELPEIILLDHLFQTTCSASPGSPPLFVDSGANDGIWYDPKLFLVYMLGFSVFTPLYGFSALYLFVRCMPTHAYPRLARPC
jgi:hypothetical protein